MTYQEIYERCKQLHLEGKSIHYMICQLAKEDQSLVDIAIDVLMDQVYGRDNYEAPYETLKDVKDMIAYERQPLSQLNFKF